MYVLKIGWILICFMAASVFLMQCEKETQQTERTGQVQSQQDEDNDSFSRHDEGRGDAAGTNGGHEINVVENQNELVDNMRELLGDLNEEFEELGDDENYDQIQNDRRELNQLITEADNANEEEWNNIKEDVQETYVRIATDYNERARPDGAHGGKSAWFLRNLG